MTSDDAPTLLIAPTVQGLLDERGIRDESLLQVISHAEKENLYHADAATGHRLAYRPLGKTTYWVEYLPEGEGFRIVTAYSHRMRIIEGFNMAPKAPQGSSWTCARCDRSLELATVKLAYLDETFAVELPACPSCQRVLVSEENAVQKMALAERMLEDK